MPNHDVQFQQVRVNRKTALNNNVHSKCHGVDGANMKRFAVVLSSLLLASSFVQAQVAVSPQLDGVMRKTASGAEEAYIPMIERSSHAANLLQLKNGDLLCVWFSGVWEGQSGVSIVYSRLSAGSHQWTLPKVINRQEGASLQNPVVFEAPDGDIWVIHTTQPANEGQKNAKVLVVKSHDQGKTWSSPQVMFDKPGAFVRNPIMIRPDGSWLLPMYFTPSEGITDGAETNYSVMKISKDHGATWSDCAVPSSNGYVQPSVVHQSEYIAFFRSRFADSIYRSTSADGCTWTAPKATSLPNNNASVQSYGLKDGRIAMVFNNTRASVVNGKPTTGPRKPLTVALSADGGETWGPMRDLELGRNVKPDDPSYAHLMDDAPGRDEYSYPTVLQMRDGSIVAAYTYRRQTIKVVRFSESWIGQAPAVKH
jgi:predicted neuraminidase